MSGGAVTSAVVYVRDRRIDLTPEQVDRFRSSYTEASGCWTWQGRLDRDGYGLFKAKRNGHANLLAAHRVAWMLHHGKPIPDGLTIDHLCCTRSCVNPSHMEPVTHKVNTLRGSNPCAVNARKTHCPRGHAYEEMNGRRICRPCRVEATRRFRKQRAQALPTP